MKDGFYKNDSCGLLYAPNFVYNKDYELLKEQHSTYTYPVDGWYWFDTLEEACEFFGLNPNDYKEEEESIIE